MFIHAAASTQDTIGWNNFFRARLSQAWRLCQPANSKLTSNKWVQSLTNWIWDTFHNSWTNRNTILFGETHETIRQVHIMRLEAKARETYEACNQLPIAHKRHHQYTPIETLLKGPPETLTMWITQAESTIQEHRKSINNGLPQQLITRYFGPR
jgi:hypothetical protein